MTGQNKKAIKQFLRCLELPEIRANDILNHLLPVAAEISNPWKRSKTFDQIKKSIVKLRQENLHLAKILFYEGRDKELTKEVLQGSQFVRFFSAKELADSNIGKYLSLGTPEKLRFVKLESNSDVWVDTCPPYVTEITNAKITSGSSLVIVDDHRALSDVLADKVYGKYASMQYDPTVLGRRHDALLIKQYEPDKELPEGAMLCGAASSAYGHWFAEFLPKLRFFEKHPRFSQIPLIIDEGMPPAHYDFLKALVDNPIYILPKGSTLLVKNLLVAPTDTYFPNDMIPNHKVPPEHQSSLTKGATEYIGKKIWGRFGAPINPKRRIFLSRRNSQWRRLLNEQEIINDLSNFGFENLHIEDYTFAEQVKIFQEAQFIVAPNGSALNNLIFSAPEVKTLLLGQKNLFNWGGWFGSFMELGYSPQYLAGELLGDKNQKHLDYVIPTSVVREKVEGMLKI